MTSGPRTQEGICSDHQWRDDIAPLLRAETTAASAGTLISFDEYKARMKPNQKHIYYIVASSRDVALASPYYETMRLKGVEVLLFYSAIDEFVVNALVEGYQQTPLRSIETAVDLSALPDAADAKPGDDEASDASAHTSTFGLTEPPRLDERTSAAFCSWLRDALPGKLSSVRASTRLVSTPALVVDHQSATFRRMMAHVDPSNAGAVQPQQLEVNMNHTLIRRVSMGGTCYDACKCDVCVVGDAAAHQRAARQGGRRASRRQRVHRCWPHRRSARNAAGEFFCEFVLMM
jgi:TNF receptor-associated protein 1